MISRHRLPELMERERATFAARNPNSQAAFGRAEHLFGRVPMTWMNKRAGAFPLYLDRARGATVTDIDGNSYADFALGDTTAMAGHSPQPVVDAVARRFGELGGGERHDADRGRRVGRRRADPQIRPPPDGVSRSPPPTPIGGRSGSCRADHRSAEDPRQQLLLPRLGRRDAHRRVGRTRQRRPEPRRQRRCAVRRHRGPVAPPSSTTSTVSNAQLAHPRRRGDPDGTRAHQHRHRAPRARLPRRCHRARPPVRIAPDHRRDSHVLRRARRVLRGVGSDAGSRRHRQGDRRRDAGRRLRHVSRSSPNEYCAAPTSISSTWAVSAARWPATRCRSPRPGPRWSTCSPMTPSRT